MPHNGELPSKSSPTVVYVGVVVPAPNYPPGRVRVEQVFADREKAQAWAREMPATMNGAYRRIEEHEVV